jgi:hypothetical protein
MAWSLYQSLQGGQGIVYHLINRHIEQLLDSINRAREIRPYKQLVGQLRRVNVATDTEFQRLYRRYWAMNAARLSTDFCAEYFSLLERLKDGPVPSVERVARLLYDVPTRADGQQTLQFAFASKMVHMLNHQLPVYDSRVARFYFLPQRPQGAPFEERLQHLLRSYEFLITEHRRVLDNGILKDAIGRFRRRFGLGNDYTDNKVVDTLIWGFTALLEKGAILNGTVRYY